MNSQQQFYIVLPSNSSMDIFPNNNIANFTVNLPAPLELDPTQWEIGLSEIQFPHLWYNVRDGKNVLIKEIFRPTVDELNKLYPINKDKDINKEAEKRKEILESQPDNTLLRYRQECNLPIGYYSSIEQLLEKF